MCLAIQRLSALCALFIIASCGSKKNVHTVATSHIDTAKLPITSQPLTKQKPRARNQMTDTMLAQIIKYYNKQYGADSLKMNIDRSDTVVELTFSDTATTEDSYNGPLFLADISLVTDINPILVGDVNGDGANDMLISVHTEGGGGGGNIWWDDYFLFLATHNGADSLANVKSDADIMDGSGYFFPENISNQVITGVGNDYAKSDGHCCPSLYYRMHVRLSKGQLTTIDKTPIAKPAGFE